MRYFSDFPTRMPSLHSISIGNHIDNSYAHRDLMMGSIQNFDKAIPPPIPVVEVFTSLKLQYGIVALSISFQSTNLLQN